MAWLTYVFPIAILLLISLFFLDCRDTDSIDLIQKKSRGIGRGEAALLMILCVVYTLTAFYKLGDREAPQSFITLNAGDELTVDLGESIPVSGIMYYIGAKNGDWELSFSDDGDIRTEAQKFDEGVSAVFKWQKPEVSVQARYLHIRASERVVFGEFAVFSGGEPVYPDAASCSAPELFDEQGVVPLRPTYLSGTYFDEVYHARTAYEHYSGIYPYEVSHPPLGKLLISLGISLFGMTPFGWRFTGTLFGALMLLPLYYLLKRMFGGRVVPLCGTAIFAFDFMHYTQTRIATIDTYAVFFIILMYLFMYLWVSGGRLRHLALCGLFFGLGAASKWTCLYAGAGLAVIWFLDWLHRLKKGGTAKKFILNCLFCVLAFVIVPAAIYYLSYIPYGRASGLGEGMIFTKDYADIVLKNQKFMLSYHQGVHSEHPYSSRWYQWIFDIRPILYYLDRRDNNMLSTFGAFSNPVLCWGGLGAMGVTAYRAVKKRDRLAGFIVLGYLAQLLPWVFISRTTFAYHYFPSEVFLLLALCYVFALYEEKNEKGWKIGVYGITGLSVALFAVFYPVLSGMALDRSLADALYKWLPSWPF